MERFADKYSTVSLLINLTIIFSINQFDYKNIKRISEKHLILI